MHLKSLASKDSKQSYRRLKKPFEGGPLLNYRIQVSCTSLRSNRIFLFRKIIFKSFCFDITFGFLLAGINIFPSSLSQFITNTGSHLRCNLKCEDNVSASERLELVTGLKLCVGTWKQAEFLISNIRGDAILTGSRQEHQRKFFIGNLQVCKFLFAKVFGVLLAKIDSSIKAVREADDNQKMKQFEADKCLAGKDYFEAQVLLSELLGVKKSSSNFLKRATSFPNLGKLSLAKLDALAAITIDNFNDVAYGIFIEILMKVVEAALEKESREQKS